ALGQIGPEARPAVPALKKVVKEAQVWAGPEAALALWRIAQLPEAMDALLVFMNDQNWFVRRSAASCLGDMGRKAKKAVLPLKQALRDEHELVRVCAAEGLWKIARNPDAVRVL